MKGIVLPIFALVAAVVGLLSAIYMGPLGIGLALATLAVAIAVIYQYTMAPEPVREEGQIEDFSWWADIGEPVAALKSLDHPDPYLASQIIASDLNVLAKNADLLSRRLALLSGRRDFQGLPAGSFSRDGRGVVSSLSDLASKLERSKTVQPEIYKFLEEQAAPLDRMANKLFEFEKGKSEVVRVYVEPLRRAAEKLSRDLRSAASNAFKFEKRLNAAAG